MVNIYIETDTKAPKRKSGFYGYVLEYKGITKEGTGKLEDCTYYQLVLTAITEALNRMVKPSRITITTDCKHVIHGYDYMDTWAAADWKKNNNESLSNAELWKEFYNLGKIHDITMFFSPAHEYSKWLREEMIKCQI